MLVNMNELLLDAQKHHYAVGLFNTIDSDAIEAAITAAETARSPIIIGTAEVLLPHGDLPLLAPSMIHMAKCASVPVVVHFDHGLTVERCKQAIELGFSSIMFDGSAGDPEANLRTTSQMVQFAHSLGISVEGEIGHVGEAITGDQAAQDMYTTPEEALAFVDATGVDALAIAIGTAHGAYKTKPKLDIQRLKQIRSALTTPLVLHGASGLSREDLHSTIREGITKMNIFTDLCTAGLQAMLQGGDDYHEIRHRKVAAIRQVIMDKMELFGSAGRC